MSSDSNSVKTREEDNDTNQKNEERAEKEATKGLEPENTTGNCYRPCPQNLEESNQMDLYTSLSNESEGRIDVINTGTQPGSDEQVQENNQKEQDQQLNKGELNEEHTKQKNQENVIKVEEIAQNKKEIQPMAREPNAMTGKTSVPGKDTHGTKSRPDDDTQLRMAVEEQEDGDKEQKNEETKEKVDDKGVEAEVMAVRYFTILTGNTIKCHNDFLEELLKYLPCLMLESVENKSDVILIFCTQPDSERTLNTLSHITVSKPAVLVVLHDTFVPDSSISVTREKTITLDCLFREDQGLLDCEKNKEALSRAAKWIEDQRTRGPSPKKHIKESAIHMSRGSRVTQSPRPHQRVKYVCIISGKTLGVHEHILQILHKQIPELQEVSTVEECDVILLFCPIVSRAGTDIEAALKLITEADSKPVVLVVLHHTFDPYCIVPDSSRSVTRKNTTTVDCLFYEDRGLLNCSKNEEAVKIIVENLKRQDEMRSQTSRTFDNGTCTCS